MRDDEYAARWASERPHVPLPLIDGRTSSVQLQQLYHEPYWAIKPEDPQAVSAELCGGFVLPPFQRHPRWTVDERRAFVESAWRGFHLGTIVVNHVEDDDREGNPHPCDGWLIDGQQRLSALVSYVNDGFRIFVGGSHEHSWSDLNLSETRHFGRIQMGIARMRSSDEGRLRELYNLMAFTGRPHLSEEAA